MSGQTQNTSQQGSVPLSNEREVVDPISHLPITIHDATKVELEQIPPPPSTQEEIKMRRRRSADTQRDSNQRHIDMEDVLHETMHESWWEDPFGNQRRARVQTAVVAAIAACVGSLGTLITSKILSSILRALFGFRGVGWFGVIVLLVACCILGLGVGFAALSVGLFQHEPEKPPPGPAKRILNKHYAAPETARWLNTFLHSVWPIINPALFTPVADMLEDSMQATLPKLVKGVRVADLGQGTESIRILGIRLLNAGAAAQDVGDLKAEEGEFINMEVAIAYRGKPTTTQGFRGRAANAHLLLEFYTSGGLMIPVWVELTGLLATARTRIQLTPNPPFISLATLSLLGLPKVTMKCTPLAKGFLNVMDVPGLSNFVQQSINLAVAEFVAPKSMALDLKTLLMGRPKMDTESAGVVIVTIRRASGFKGGSGVNPFKSEDTKQGDVYVTVCWSKWGKPLWSTRIIASGDPVWEETTAVLVGPAELNAQENLKLQLWDSDKYTADDSIGNISVPLRELLESKTTLNHMSVREDPLVAEDGKTRLPGTITWECGFFAKTTLDQHLARKQQDPDEFRKKVEAEAESKLREAKILETETGDDEIQQQKNEDLKEKTDEVISSSKPTSEWPSGILSIRIEQITGLEIQHIRESGVPEDAEALEGEDLPSAYCTIIINHQRVYKTRTKMKSNDPYFDAGTEKFIRNWRTTDLIISVRDRRFHETDPVVGVVILPIQDILKRTSQWSDTMPLVGGIGYGRMKVSLLFRSVQLQLPKRLLGWDVGTLEIEPSANSSDNTPAELSACRLIFRAGYGKGKMYSDRAKGGWAQSHNEPIRLAVLHRYASCLLIQFKKRVAGPDITPAFCTLWLKDIPDDTPVELALPIRENANRSLARSEKNATQDIGKLIGTLYLRVRFHSGLSGYHKRYASRDKGLEDVIQVLDYAEEAEGVGREADESMYDDPSLVDSLSSSDSDDETDDGMGGAKKKKSSSVKQNPFPAETKGALAGFRKHQNDLHRRHRGLLQWSGARKLAWIGKGLEHRAGKAKSAIQGLSKHSAREIPMEKEIN